MLTNLGKVSRETKFQFAGVGLDSEDDRQVECFYDEQEVFPLEGNPYNLSAATSTAAGYDHCNIIP